MQINTCVPGQLLHTTHPHLDILQHVGHALCLHFKHVCREVRDKYVLLHTVHCGTNKSESRRSLPLRVERRNRANQLGFENVRLPKKDLLMRDKFLKLKSVVNSLVSFLLHTTMWECGRAINLIVPSARVIEKSCRENDQFFPSFF